MYFLLTYRKNIIFVETAIKLQISIILRINNNQKYVFEMSDSVVALLIKPLQQNKGKLSLSYFLKCKFLN